MKKWLFSLLLLTSNSWASIVKVNHASDGWQLLVDSVPYIIHGVGYDSTATGQNPNVCSSSTVSGGAYYSTGYWDWAIQTADQIVPTVGITTSTIIGPYLSYNDQSRINQELAYETTSYGQINGDFGFMKAMGVNTIRIYTHPSSATITTSCYSNSCESQLLYNHPPNLPVLRDLFNTYGIRYAIGDEIGAYAGSSCVTYPGPTDYTNATQLQNMSNSVQQMVREFKNEPGLLMYILGNENNYQATLTNAYLYPQQYYTFVDSLAVIIHNMDPNHPVALSDGEDGFVNYVNTYAPHLDIYGVNSYRNPGGFNGFDTLWTEVSTALSNSKPLMLTEFGLYYPHMINPGGAVSNDSIIDGNYDAAVRENYWCDIENHTEGHLSPQNAIGGFNYEWLDEWWQGGNAYAINVTTPTIANLAVQGIAAQGAGTNSPYARQFRPSYYMYQRIWTSNSSCECGTSE